MRGSSARLAGTDHRLGDLAFPARRFLLARTRLAFVHLENLVSWAKRDRDGRVDGFVQGWLPDEVLLLPESIDSFTVVRGGLQSTRRSQRFADYRRFVTGGRVLQ